MFFRLLSSKILLFWVIKGLLLVSYPQAWAQNTNPPRSTPFILPPTPPQPIPLPQTPPSPQLEIPPLTLPSPEDQPNLPQNITVTRFEFEGNTAFSDGELAEVIAPFTDKPITFAQLLQAEAAISQYYIDAGYINSGAIIPAGQVLNPNDAVVKIQIIEGSIEEIIVTVEGRLNPNYVRKRLALATQIPLNQNRLLEALQLLQLDPLIETISADLSAGTRPELSILSVKVKEADTFQMNVFLDNYRVPSIGTFERGIGLTQANLLGIGDSLNLEYANTDGSNAFYGTYTIPVNARNGKVQFNARGTLNRVVEPPFDSLDIKGNSLYLDVSYRQPVINTPTQELALGVTFSRASSKSRIFDLGFPLSPGANDQGETRISALRFFQEWTKRGSQDVLVLRSQFSVGLDLFNATINDDPPDSRFFEWQGQGQYVRSLAPDTLLVLRSAAQLTTRPLVPLEQYTLGGVYTVRGYQQDLYLTDNGIFAAAEVRFPILRVNEVQGVLQIAPFVDFGVAWNNLDNPIVTPNPNTLVGVGLGLQWQMGNDLTARFDWGIPLVDVDDGNRTLQEQGLYFSINYNFF